MNAQLNTLSFNTEISPAISEHLSGKADGDTVRIVVEGTIREVIDGNAVISVTGVEPESYPADPAGPSPEMADADDPVMAWASKAK